MKRNSLAICLLSLSAVVLITLNFLLENRASAIESVSDRDYTMVTARIPQGGDALYVVEKRSGVMVVLTWDANQRGMTVRTSGALGSAQPQR